MELCVLVDLNSYIAFNSKVFDTLKGLPEESQFEEGLSLSSEVVHLIGGMVSPALLQEVCRDALLAWLKGSHCSRCFLLPLAASISKGVLHLHHRSPLLNECILAILTHAG